MEKSQENCGKGNEAVEFQNPYGSNGGGEVGYPVTTLHKNSNGNASAQESYGLEYERTLTPSSNNRDPVTLATSGFRSRTSQKIHCRPLIYALRSLWKIGVQ